MRYLLDARAVLALLNDTTSPIARSVRQGGKVRPSTSALERFAEAIPTRLRIVFELQASN